MIVTRLPSILKNITNRGAPSTHIHTYMHAGTRLNSSTMYILLNSVVYLCLVEYIYMAPLWWGLYFMINVADHTIIDVTYYAANKGPYC